MANGPMLLDERIRSNKRKTIFIVAFMLFVLWVLLIVVGWLLGLPLLLVVPIALVASLIYLLIAGGGGVKAILAATQARPANAKVRQEKLLVYKVEELSIAAGLPQPKVYVQDSKDINAFAAGKDPSTAVVCVTTGALDLLTHEELEGVLAHELAHVKNYDVRLATWTLAIVGIIAIFVEIAFRAVLFGGIRPSGGNGKGGGLVLVLMIVGAIVFMVLAPFISRFAYLAMSRRREYLADATGAHMSRNPEGLASALEKILNTQPKDPKGSRTAAALYIANPWKRSLRQSLWSTHPPLVERIRRLRGEHWKPAFIPAAE